jgi:hypothetical protein
MQEKEDYTQQTVKECLAKCNINNAEDLQHAQDGLCDALFQIAVLKERTTSTDFESEEALFSIYQANMLLRGLGKISENLFR